MGRSAACPLASRWRPLTRVTAAHGGCVTGLRAARSRNPSGSCTERSAYARLPVPMVRTDPTPRFRRTRRSPSPACRDKQMETGEWINGDGGMDECSSFRRPYLLSTLFAALAIFCTPCFPFCTPCFPEERLTGRTPAAPMGRGLLQRPAGLAGAAKACPQNSTFLPERHRRRAGEGGGTD